MDILGAVSTFVSGWVAAHAALVSVLVVILACIVIVDHYLASTGKFASNSTAQAVLKWVGVVADDALKILSPSTEAEIPQIKAPAQAAAPAAPAPAAPATPPSTQAPPSA